MLIGCTTLGSLACNKLQAAFDCMQDLHPLVYPLTQVLLGTVRLVPTPRYFPLRLRCIRALMNMGRAVGQFIPLSPVLLEMLQWGELSKRPQAGAGGMPDMALQLRVSKNSLKIPGFQEEVVSQVHVLQSVPAVAELPPLRCLLGTGAMQSYNAQCVLSVLFISP